MTRLLSASVPAQRRPRGTSASACSPSAPVAEDVPPDDLPSAVLRLAEADADGFADALHDGALQALVVARYAADAAVRGGDAVAARQAVQDALVALRRAVWLLRPRGDDGLVPALRDLARHLDATGAAPLRLELDGPAEIALEQALDPASATAAYRLVQRAAGGRPLTVRLRRTPTALAVDLDAAVPDPVGEALRARAVGATLITRSDSSLLLLPLPSSTGFPVPAGLPSCEEAP